MVRVHLDPPPPCGALAQLGERLICIQEVIGSIPIGSTIADKIIKRMKHAFDRPVGRQLTSFREKHQYRLAIPSRGLPGRKTASDIVPSLVRNRHGAELGP